MPTTAPADHPAGSSTALPRPRRRLGRRALLGAGSALLAGLVAGLAARGLMRVAALAVDGDTGFSVVGSVMICVFFGVAVLPGAVVRATGARRSGGVLIALGTALVALQSVMIGVQDLGHEEISGPTLAAVVAVTAGFAVVVAGLGVLAWRWASAVARKAEGAASGAR